jgi:hypothetical protein
MRLINIENTQFSMSEAQLYDELFIRASLSTYCHQHTCINISQDSYLLAPERSQMLVVTKVDMQLQFTFIYSIAFSEF